MGNNFRIYRIKKWCSHRCNRLRVMIIIGPSGSGKTTLLHSILADYKSGTLLHPDERFSVVCEQVKHAKLAFPPRIKELLMVDDMDEIYKSGFEFKMVLYRIIKNYKGHLICCFNSYESAEEFINMFKKNRQHRARIRIYSASSLEAGGHTYNRQQASLTMIGHRILLKASCPTKLPCIGQ